MNKAFWLSILGDCWEKSICCSLPARLMEEFPANKVYLQPTTCNLVYWGVLPGVVDRRCNSPGQWRGRKGPTPETADQQRLRRNPETELLPKFLSIYWKCGSNFCRLINLSHSLFCPTFHGQWNSHFLRKNSERKAGKGTTFLTFRLFLGIFQWNYLETSSVH